MTVAPEGISWAASWAVMIFGIVTHLFGKKEAGFPRLLLKKLD
jgi:hypothetical protein